MPADPAVVVAARDGDPQALAQLLAEHLPVVYNIVGRALGGHPDVDDVVQETMLRAVQALPSLREPDRFRSWLVAIAVRQVRERERERSATLARRHAWAGWDEQAAWQERADPDADFADDVITRAHLAEERQALREATGWLDAEDRRVLALWWQELLGSLSRAEVAEALGLTLAHAAVRIQRMRGHLSRARLILAAWRSMPRCAGLTAAAHGWDGGAEPRWVKRLHRHVRDCPQCLAISRTLIADDTALAHIGPLPVTGGLVAAVTSSASAHAHPAGIADGWWQRLWEYLSARPAGTAGAGAGVAAAIAATAILLPGTPTPTPPDAAQPAATPPPVTITTAPASQAPTPAPSATPAGPLAGPIYLSPNGSDASGDGSNARPFATLTKAASTVQPGQTIVARGGVYQPTQAVEIRTSGTEANRITLTNAPGERPVFDAGRIPVNDWFITQTASYWTVRGLEIRNAPKHAYVCVSCRSGVFSGLSIHDSHGIGLLLRGEGTESNQVLNGDFYRNHDPGSSADGLAFKYGSGNGNLVRGCRFWGNIDDGLDLHEFASAVTVDHSWAYANGVDYWHDAALAVPGAGNGFRLGGGNPAPPAAHIVTNSAAWDNTGYGFTESANRGGLRLTSNTAYRNGKDGFAFFYSTSQFKHNLALANGRQAVLAENAMQDSNSWNQPGWTTGTLLETDPRTAQQARTTDGSLPSTAFLTNGRDASVGAPMR